MVAVVGLATVFWETSIRKVAASTWMTDGSLTNVQSVISYQAKTGDTVLLPSGTFIWGTNGARLYITKRITLQGNGTNTVIVLANNGPIYGSSVITLGTNAWIRSFSILGGKSMPVTAFGTSCDGFRISEITYTGISSGYLLYTSAYGLVDNCDITGGSGSHELIFARGSADSWTTPSSMGTTRALCIENNRFHGQGYVCDINSYGRAVVRFNVIDGSLKVDGHGKASNSPARGVRQMEVYNNIWTLSAGPWPAIEIRGGTGFLFGNILQHVSPSSVWFFLCDYGCLAQWPNFTNTYQTPLNYPIDDQIGVGMDPKTAASEPVYLWRNFAAPKNGTTDGSLGDWTLASKAIPAAAVTLYQGQTGNSNATFAMTNLIAPDRDFFKESTNGFDGSSGVGVGSKDKMLAITPTRTGVGFWVTNEGNWNTTITNNGYSGKFYCWNGKTWTNIYTPLVYPHPLALATNVVTIAPPVMLRIEKTNR